MLVNIKHLLNNTAIKLANYGQIYGWKNVIMDKLSLKEPFHKKDMFNCNMFLLVFLIIILPVYERMRKWQIYAAYDLFS